MTDEKNGYCWFKRMGWITGGLIGIITLTGLIMGILAQLYIFPVTATKEALNAYVTKEVFNLRIEQFEKQLAETKKEISETKTEVRKIYNLLLSMKKGGETDGF